MYVTEHDPLPDELGVFARTYRSLSSHSEMRWFGIGWFSAFDATLDFADDTATVYTEHQTYVVFDKQSDGTWKQSSPDAGALPGSLTGDETTGYTFRAGGTDLVRMYAAGNHRLTGIGRLSDNAGVNITYDSAGKPTAVADIHGRWSATITTNTASLITQIAVDGNPDLVWNYGYTNGNVYLGSVKLASAPVAWRTYEYESQNFLARIKDSAGVVLEEHAYDGLGRATSSLGPGRDLTNIAYQATSGGVTTTTVTDASGTTTYYLEDRGQIVTTRVEGTCTSCGTHNQVYAYDDRSRLVRVQDGRGYVTQFNYGLDDTRVTSETGPLTPSGCNPETATDHCRLTSSTLGSAILTATPATTTVTYGYNLVWTDRIGTIQRASVMTPGAFTTQTFGFNQTTGATELVSVSGRTGSDAHVETHTTTTAVYNGTESAAFDPGGTFQTSWLTLPQPGGLTLTVDGPRVDVSDVTTYVYYPRDTAVPSRLRGQLAAIRNSLGHTTRYDDYDVFGRPLSTTDANGVTTTAVYDALGRVTTTTLSGVSGCDTTADPLCATAISTSNAYANVTGPLLSTTTSSGVSVFTYDTGGRVATISRGPTGTDLRERVKYTYDPVSEQKASEVYEANVGGTWVEKRRETYAYDDEGRLLSVTHPDNSAIRYTYDDMDRVATVRDENHATPNTTYSYDPRGRLASVKQTLAGAPSNQVTTSYTYDAHDNLASVTDPNGNITTYQYDDFGQLVQQASPVTGTTTYSYDPAGNILTTTDANSSTTTRTYDVSNRITASASSRSGVTETVNWTYDDAGTFGRGRLRTMTDPTGSTTYAYDRRGLLLSEQKAIGGATFTSRYQYDRNGNRTRMTYPSGRVVDYTFDYADRSYSATTGGTTLVSSASYLPFGPVVSTTYGNGTTKSVTYDNRYLITENKLTGPSGTIARYTYAHDLAGNITQQNDAVDATFNRTYAYDDLNRLTTANTGSSLWGNGAYTYDLMGNMKTVSLGNWRAGSFTHQSTTPKIAAATENSISRSVTYDAAGNEVAVGASTYDYSPRNSLRSGEGFTYAYDGRGVRTITSFTDPGITVSIIAVSPTTLTAGSNSTATVTLSGSAPAGGATITLGVSNPGVVHLPASVTIPAGNTTGTFTITTSEPAANYTAVIHATFFDGTKSTALTVTTPPAVTSVTVNPSTPLGGASATGTVTLDNPATGSGSVVTLSSSDAHAVVPASVTVPTGTTSATFAITTTSPDADTSVTISATLRQTRTTIITVRATPVELQSLSITPANMVGGAQQATGTLTLSANAPTGGATVALSSSDTSVATVPATVVVPAGTNSASFTITTVTVTSNTPVTISGSYGTTQSAGVTVTSCSGMIVPAASVDAAESVWVEDAIPAGATTWGSNWTWDTTHKASGTQSHSATSTGPLEEHLFDGAATNMWMGTRDLVTTWVLLDPCNPPREILLSWRRADQWQHRAYWGENLVNAGTNNTESRRYMGPLPTAGVWTRLEVPASSVGLHGQGVDGLFFSIYGGKVWFDRSGRRACSTLPAVAAPANLPQTDTVWVEDDLPTGATSTNWTWATSQKASGTRSSTHTIDPMWPRSEHYFSGATQTITPGVGDKLVAYVLLDPCAPPQEVMLQFEESGGWEHRGYWGQDLIGYGVNGTNSRRRIGDLPVAGQWVRLEIAAADIGLEGVAIKGFGIQTWKGIAWVDRIGISPAGSSALRNQPPVLVAATDDAPLLSRRTRMWAWVKRRFRRAPDPPPVSFAIMAQVMDAGQTKQRYSLYTPELNLMAETTTTAATPSIAYDYVWFGGEPLAQIETASSALHWYFNDRLGAPLLTTSNTGVVDWRGEREPYGSRYTRIGVERHQPLGLPGQEVGESAERQYNIFRWYRHGWGRYTQVDPLFADASFRVRRASNEFGYADATPTTRVDATGLCSSCDVCPSGIWTVDPFGQAGMAAAIVGISVQRAHMTCRDNGYSVRIETSCAMAGAMLTVGLGFTGPGRACGCNVGQLINNGQTTRGWTASAGPLGVNVDPCTAFDPTAVSGTLGKSWLGGGFARTWCTSKVIQ
jgi:RHS repeat-associated protein